MTYRLLKVICRPVLVGEDDNGYLTETFAEPIAVAAADWPAYPARLLDQIAGLGDGQGVTREDPG